MVSLPVTTTFTGVGTVPVATVVHNRLGTAAALAALLKSYEPGTWHCSQLFSMPGYPTVQYLSPAEASQENLFTRLPAAWMECTASLMFTPQPLLTRLTLWQKVQVGASLRWPAWKVLAVNTPSTWWQALQRAFSTIARRAVAAVKPAGSVPLTSLATLGAGTLKPPILVVLL